MDKPSEQKKSHKSADDKDIGVHEYGIGNKREQLDGLWAIASEKVVGLPPSRVITDVYRKKEGKGKEDKKDVIESILESGPPLMNMSKPHRVF